MGKEMKQKAEGEKTKRDFIAQEPRDGAEVPLFIRNDRRAWRYSRAEQRAPEGQLSALPRKIVLKGYYR